MRYCEYAVNEDNGGHHPGSEYEGKQDTTGMLPMMRRLAGTTQLARMTASKIRWVRWQVRRDG